MSIQKEVQGKEQELFNVLTLSFNYAQTRQFPKLKVCIEALLELEKEYKEITHVNFIRMENVERLLTELDKLEKVYNGKP